MSGLSRQGKGSRLVGLFLLISAAGVPVDAADPFNQAGRLFGICWSDGYHACASSGIRPGADFPPASYSESQGCAPMPVVQSYSHQFHTGGATFYDRFDMTNPRAGIGCGCDGTTIPSMYGSEVILQTSPPEKAIMPPTPAPEIQQSRNPSSSRFADIGPSFDYPSIDRTAPPGVLLTETPNRIVPSHPGDRPIVEHSYATNEHGGKLYPSRLPATPPPQPESMMASAPTRSFISRQLAQMEGVGAIQTNPFVSGDGVGMARQSTSASSGPQR